MDILGHSVLYYPANAAKNAHCIDSLYCSSDDEKALSAIYGTCANIVLNIMLVYFMGVQSATIATVVSSYIIYYDAVYLIPVISLSSYFTFLYSLSANIEFFFEANKFITMASITGAVVNVVLNYVLMPIFGYYAAGYTTLFCYILFSLGHYIFMRIVCKKKLGGDRVYNGTVILLVSVAFVILAFGMMLIYDYPLIRYTLILAVLVVCFVMRERIMSYFKMIKER